MASETKRGCGYRKVGGLYLCGDFVSVPCDRLPYELKSCPVCGAGIHFSRAMTEINPLKLFGNHDYDPSKDENFETGLTPALISIATTKCTDKNRPCLMCDPPDAPAYIMGVGKRQYTPQSFTKEAVEMGVSKRIAHVPKNLKLGETIVYLAHPEAIDGVKQPSEQGELLGNGQARLVDADKIEKRLGIFCAFIPQRVEMPVWKSKLTKKKGELEKRGITPIPIKDGDKDHK